MKNRLLSLYAVLMLILYTLCAACTHTGVSGEKAGNSSAGNYPPAGTKQEFRAGTIKFTMCFVPAKVFKTGTDDSGLGRVEKSFWLGETEITYGLWYEVREWAVRNGYSFGNSGREGHDGTDGAPPTAARNEPVTLINWRDAVIWCNALTEYYNQHNRENRKFDCVYYSGGSFSVPLRMSTGEEVVSHRIHGSQDAPYIKEGAFGFRLPGNAEWELAARYREDANDDGDITDPGEYYPGSNASGAFGDFTSTSETGKVSWFSVNSSGSTHDVGTKTANGLSIFDMSGNVWEWCFERFPGKKGFYRIARGGGWHGSAHYLPVGCVAFVKPVKKHEYLGFRVAKNP